jgi:hypothetical protein
MLPAKVPDSPRRPTDLIPANWSVRGWRFRPRFPGRKTGEYEQTVRGTYCPTKRDQMKARNSSDAHKAGISQTTDFNRKKKYGVLLPARMKWVRQHADENAQRLGPSRATRQCPTCAAASAANILATFYRACCRAAQRLGSDQTKPDFDFRWEKSVAMTIRTTSHPTRRPR